MHKAAGPNILARPNRMRTLLNFSSRRRQASVFNASGHEAGLPLFDNGIARPDCCCIAARISKEATETAETRDLRRRNEPSL